MRRQPRGAPKRAYAFQNWYDIRLPNLSPAAEIMKLGRAAESEKGWDPFLGKFRAEMSDPDKSRILDLLAALSHHADFSVGCQARCHRSVLRALLAERGAEIG